MQFEIAGRRMKMGVSNEPMTDRWAEVDRVDGRISISPDCPAEERTRVFFHEVGHLLIGAGLPDPMNDEERFCDAIGAHLSGILLAFERQGGVPALMALEESGKRGEPDSKELPVHPVTVQCVKCRLSMTEGSTVSQHVPHPRVVGGTYKQAFYCSQCNHIQRWTVVATLQGLPSSVVLDGPTFTADQTEVNQFLAEHGWRYERQHHAG